MTGGVLGRGNEDELHDDPTKCSVSAGDDRQIELQSPSRSAAAMAVVTRERVGLNVGKTTWICRGCCDHTPRVPLTLLSIPEQRSRLGTRHQWPREDGLSVFHSFMERFYVRIQDCALMPVRRCEASESASNFPKDQSVQVPRECEREATELTLSAFTMASRVSCLQPRNLISDWAATSRFNSWCKYEFLE
jgi:hypothetical protein